MMYGTDKNAGVIPKEIADKLNAYGFDVIETRRMKDWVSMTAKMR